MTPPVLAASGITKNYRLGKQSIPVLRGVDLAVQQGEILALLGASGAGKSTLLHVLGLLDQPTTGEILFDGVPVQNLSVRERARLRHSHTGFVFQFYHLIPELTALQNVMLAGMMTKSVLQYWANRKQARREATEILEQVGLADRLKHRPSELSGGERQRVAIARALANDPALILGDEPTGNLDSVNSARVVEVLRNLAHDEGRAVVCVTHDLAIADISDVRIEMLDGRIERIVDQRAPAPPMPAAPSAPA